MTTLEPPPFCFESIVWEPGSGAAPFEAAKGVRICSQGDLADGLYYLRRGRAKRTRLVPAGKESVVSLVNPGEFFGECCLTGVTRHAISVVALTPCVGVRIAKPVAVNLFREDSSFASALFTHLLARNLRMEEDLLHLLCDPIEQRLARALVQLAGASLTAGLRSEPIRISQGTLAEMIGTTRGRVNVLLKKFRQEGWVDYAGGLIVCRRLSEATEQG